MMAMRVKADFGRLQKYRRRDPENWQKAMEKGAIQLLTWMNTGSGGSKSSAKPPIRFGVLRGSSSAFVNGKYVGAFPIAISPGADEKPDPNKSHKGKGITVGWNTVYAARMHETDYEVQRDGEKKWIEKHLAADKDILMKFIAGEMKKGMK